MLSSLLGSHLQRQTLVAARNIRSVESRLMGKPSTAKTPVDKVCACGHQPTGTRRVRVAKRDGAQGPSPKLRDGNTDESLDSKAWKSRRLSRQRDTSCQPN